MPAQQSSHSAARLLQWRRRPGSVPPGRCMTSSRESKPGCHGRGVRPRAVRARLSGAGSLPAPEQRCLAFGSDAPSRKRLTVDPADRHLHSPMQHERVRSARTGGRVSAGLALDMSMARRPPMAVFVAGLTVALEACCNAPRAMVRSRLPTLRERRRQLTSRNRLGSGSSGLCIVQHETELTSFARRLNTCIGGRP
jgi:hypothetical protein